MVVRGKSRTYSLLTWGTKVAQNRSVHQLSFDPLSTLFLNLIFTGAVNVKVIWHV